MEEYASIYANIDELQKQLLIGKRITVLQISKNFQESKCSGVLF